MCKCAEPGLGPDPSLCSQNLLATQANPSTFDLPPPRAPADMAQGPAVTAPLLQLNFSEHLYFENSLQNLKAGAQRSLKKLREKVDQNL